MTRKSVRTTYHIQTNDGGTAELIALKKIKGHREIKNYPVETLGASGDNAWVFIGEPLAFDAFTLAKAADVEILEAKNPSLKGMFPAEKQYYSFNRNDKNIYFTAKNGSKWQLNTATLLASATEYDENANEFDNRLSAVEALIKQNQAEQDSNYRQNNRDPVQKYRVKEINYEQYQAISKVYYQQREALDKVRDSLWKMKSGLEKNKRSIEDREREIENLQRTGLSFSQVKASQDTAGNIWWGIYDEKEMKELYDRVSYNNAHDETARRNLWMSEYHFEPRYDDNIIDKSAAKKITTKGFLSGGFLLDKETAKPIRLGSKGAFLVAHKDQVGREGKILLSKVGPESNDKWEVNTGLTEWADWMYKGNRLYVFGTDNKELSSGEVNLLLCINLDNGSVSRYDYFKKSIRK